MSKTYLKMILVSTLLTTFLVLSFAFSAKNIFNRITLDMIHEKNNKELNIISSYIQDMHDNVQQFTYQLSNNTSLDTLLRDISMDSVEGYNTMIELFHQIRINPLFHSVSLYSGYTGEYYSTLTSHSGEDLFLRQMIKDLDTVSILQPICRTLPQDIYYVSTTVFSYFYFKTDNHGETAEAITVNINANKLCDYLNKLKGNGAQAYIIDLHNNSIIDSTAQIHKVNDTNLTFIQKIVDSGTIRGCFIDNLSDQEQLITYQLLENPNWILIMQEPNNYLQSVITSTHAALIIIMLILIFIGLIISLLFFYRLYRPWGKLYHQVVGNHASASTPSRFYDDVEAINQSIQLTQNQLEDYLKYKNSTGNLLLESYIRALLREDVHFIEKLTDSDRNTFEQFLSQSMQIAVFRIDHWKQIKTTLSGSSDACTYSLIQFSNQVFPTLPDKQLYKWVYLGRGQFLLLTFFTSLQVQTDIQWREMATYLLQLFTDQTGIAATISIGGKAGTVTEFMNVTHIAIEHLDYSILFDRQCILDCQTIENRVDQTFSYNEQLEWSLQDVICKGQKEETLQIFEEILEEYRQGDWQTFILYLTRLFLHLDKQIDKIHRGWGTKERISGSFYQILSESKTLDDIRENFVDKLEKMPTHEESIDFKTSMVIKSVKEYINEHYKEDISLKGIAAKFNLSQGYLGTLFKDTLGMSILEYINEVRLQQSGFINESNFYKLFKRRFGLTPKNYRLKK